MEFLHSCAHLKSSNMLLIFQSPHEELGKGTKEKQSWGLGPPSAFFLSDSVILNWLTTRAHHVSGHPPYSGHDQRHPCFKACRDYFLCKDGPNKPAHTHIPCQVWTHWVAERQDKRPSAPRSSLLGSRCRLSTSFPTRPVGLLQQSSLVSRLPFSLCLRRHQQETRGKEREAVSPPFPVPDHVSGRDWGPFFTAPTPAEFT